MAGTPPVVDTVVPSQDITLNPGQQIDIVVTAHDPDSKKGTLTGAIEDGQGNSTNVVVNLTVNDPLTFKPPVLAGLTGATVQMIINSATSVTYRVKV